MGFESITRLLKDGDPASAGVLNRPLSTIDQNTRYIYQLLSAAGVGATVYARRQPVAASVLVGSPVWFNPATEQFENGLALAEIDNATGAVTTSPSSQIWGVVATKISATLADILCYGIAEIDISAAVVGDLDAGLYYLSSGAAGKLTLQRPPISIPVLQTTGDGRVFVRTQLVDFIDRHTHYRFNLVCYPAGEHTPPLSGERHVITSPDSSRRGWLPAGDAIFEDLAPDGAAFGYNIGQDTALRNVWPPLPFGNAELVWDKGLDAAIGGTSVPLGKDGLVVIDKNGLWWMSDCEGDVPWPADLNTATGSLSYSDSADVECPRHLFMSLALTFAKVNFITDTTAVLSLRPNDSRIKITCYGTETDGTVGHLQIALDLDFATEEDAAGYLALKSFDQETGVFKRGPVTEGVYALSGSVSIGGSISATRTIDGETRTVYSGLVGVSVEDADSKELLPQLVRLNGVEEQYTGTPPVMYLGFRAERKTTLRSRFVVPDGLTTPTPKARLRLRLLGTAAGTLPELTVSARLIPRPSALLTPVALPEDDAEFDVVCNAVADLNDSHQYVEALAEPFDIAAGDVVYIEIERQETDDYAGEVGILKHTLIIDSE